ncbi:MAG: ABC transporter permease [Nitrososphaerota archaeon]|nr:ABC transporter permease [Nitrososphaerota archaeon]
MSDASSTEQSKSEPSGSLSFYFKFFARDKPALVGLVMIIVFLVWAFVEAIMQEIATLFHHEAYGWMLIPSNPFALNFGQKLLPPSLNQFPNLIFGTNYQGQSIFSRLLYATPHDAEAPIVIVGSAIIIGMLLGSASGYYGGWIDEVIMRATDAFLSLPALILAITVSVLMGPGFTSLLYALIIVWWPTYARFFRGQALTLRQKGYVESSKLSGAGSFRILLKHIIPNSIDPIIAYATLDLGTVILTYSTLAFLGIGISFNYPEWGAESSSGLGFFPAEWWWAIIPGLLIAIVVIAFTLVGDRLQDLIGGRMSY